MKQPHYRSVTGWFHTRPYGTGGVVTQTLTWLQLLSHLFRLGYCLEVATLSPDQDTIHEEKGCTDMCDFCMAALMFLTGHGMKVRTHAHVEIAHSPTWCIIRTWKALCLQPHASQALLIHLGGKCVAQCFLGSDDASSWEMCDFCTGTRSQLVSR